MKEIDDFVCRETLPELISELEAMADLAGVFSTGAILVLKNTLQPVGPGGDKQAVRFEVRFDVPGNVTEYVTNEIASAGVLGGVRRLVRDFWHWIIGNDHERFRDRCDRYLWRAMVPTITEGFGELADEILNTINEAIINYAEYSFGRLSVGRRIQVHLFRTDADLAYAIIRPKGTRLKSFDPLELKIRPTNQGTLKKRGWGHTLLMERALFLSFDQEPKRRGMMIIIGEKP